MSQNQSEINQTIQSICIALNLDSNNPPVHISPDQAAKVLDLEPGTLSVWRSTGRYRLPYIKAGRLVRYRLDGLAEFIIRRTHNSETKGE